MSRNLETLKEGGEKQARALLVLLGEYSEGGGRERESTVMLPPCVGL